MSDIVARAEQALLQPAELSADAVAGVLGSLVQAPGVDAADLYFQHQISESWVLEDGIVKDGSFHVDQGVPCPEKRPALPTAMTFAWGH